ncbi:MAG: glycosyltransferase family 4 protein [Nanobdellota archaeon]
MRVLMFGWEFPPYFAGGVGIVCFELTQELSGQGTSIDYIMPSFPLDKYPSFLNIVDSKKQSLPYSKELSSLIHKRTIKTLLTAYQTKEEYEQLIEAVDNADTSKDSGLTSDNTLKLYGDDLFDEIQRFANQSSLLYKYDRLSAFDVIHAHDWTTIPAAIEMKHLSQKPLVIHCHITEFNKSGGKSVDPDVYAVEKKGFEQADKVIAVSNVIKQTIIEKYHIDGNKITVIHNGPTELKKTTKKLSFLNKQGPIVSFMGRITEMKGPKQFVQMAKKVLRLRSDVTFVMAGTGDQLKDCIQLAQDLGIRDNFYFHGFYTREEGSYLYDISDVFILPSLMEPFGITPFEAMHSNTPVILTKQSGASEVLNHCLKIDYWDVKKMASYVLSLLQYSALHSTLKHNGKKEVSKLNWTVPAKKCRQVYTELIEGN